MKEIEEQETELYSRTLGIVNGYGVPRWVIVATIANLLFACVGLQYFSVLQVLGTIRIPAVAVVLASLGGLSLSLMRIPFSFQLRVFAVFLLFEAVRGVFGKAIESIVVNDQWHFSTWLLLLMHFLGMMVPISIGFASGARLRSLVSFLVFAGFILSVWSITHSGFGPGGYLGDENDNCLVLVSILPIAFIFSHTKKGLLRKVIGVVVGILLVLGIVMTKSRGGFLGFATVVIFQFYLSPSKFRWILSAFMVTLISLPFIPSEYFDEVKSIGKDARENSGTVKERLETWSTITRMWLDPKNTLFGVGLENSKWNLRDYETAERGVYLKSLSGRATHSLYFQVLGDLGIWGVSLFALLYGTSLLQLRRVLKFSKLARRNLVEYAARFKVHPSGRSFNPNASDKDTPAGGMSEVAQRSIALLSREVAFVSSLSYALICSWFGVLGAALGISVAYYPTTWLLVAMSAAVFSYWQRLEMQIKKLGLEMQKPIV